MLVSPPASMKKNGRAIAQASVRLGDRTLSKGAVVEVCPWLLHRNPDLFPDPDRFDPIRFAPTDKPKKDRPYFPFSLGPRRCLGVYFSFLEMKVHLGLLLPRFRMRLVDDSDPGLVLAINLRSARDIYVHPEERNAS